LPGSAKEMRLLLSLTCAIAACATLGGCGGMRSESTSESRYGHTTTQPEPAPVAHKLASWPCAAPDVATEHSELIPGTPCAILLSRYRGLPARPGTQLAGRVEVRRRSLLQALTNEFNALPPPLQGNYSCPSDDGSEIVAVLKYTHHQSLRLEITLTGCSTARRGSVNRSALGRAGEQLIGRLERLVAHR
jgi:hypothetical protein